MPAQPAGIVRVQPLLPRTRPSELGRAANASLKIQAGGQPIAHLLLNTLTSYRKASTRNLQNFHNVVTSRKHKGAGHSLLLLEHHLFVDRGLGDLTPE
jgi:hypothetical protein